MWCTRSGRAAAERIFENSETHTNLKLELRREKSRNTVSEKRFSQFEELQETVEEFDEKNKRLTNLNRGAFKEARAARRKLKRKNTQISRLQGKTGSSCSKYSRSKLAPDIRELIEDAEFDRDQAFVELDNVQQEATKAFVESKKGSVERTLLEAVGKKGEHYDYRVIELAQNLSSRGMNAEQVAGALNAILVFEAHSDAKGGVDHRLIDARRVREWSEWIYPMMRWQPMIHMQYSGSFQRHWSLYCSHMYQFSSFRANRRPYLARNSRYKFISSVLRIGQIIIFLWSNQ